MRCRRADAVFGPRPALFLRLSKTECLRAVQDGYARATWTRGQMREFRYRAQKARPRVSEVRELAGNVDRANRKSIVGSRVGTWETPNKSIASHRVRTTKRGPRLASDHK